MLILIEGNAINVQLRFKAIYKALLYVQNNLIFIRNL